MVHTPNIGVSQNAFHRETLRLPDAATHIRLLELVDRNTWPETKLACQLSVWPIDKAPLYHAVSYTWGNQFPIESIMIYTAASRRHEGVHAKMYKQTSATDVTLSPNLFESAAASHLYDKVWEGLLSIRQNCLDVLHQLNHFRASRYYWIDAICIDQKSDFEKGEQVAIMANIFKRAEHVLVFVGPACESDAGNAMLMINKLEQSSASNSNMRLPRPRSWQNQEKGAILEGVTRIANVLGSELDRFWVLLTALSAQPYFQRLWVVQELLLARKASICCSKQLQSVAIVAYYLSLARVLHLPNPGRKGWPKNILRALPQATGRISILALRLLIQHLANTNTKGNISKVRWYKFSHPSETVWAAVSHQCSDPRDTVYGMLALIDWNGREPIKPEYNRSAHHLATKFLGYGCPISIARRLLRNLRVTSDYAEVRYATTMKQRDHGSLDQRTAPCQLSPTGAMVTGIFGGFQVLESSTPFSHRMVHITRLGLKVHIYAMKVIGIAGIVFAASDIKQGDCIVFDNYSFSPHGLVIRDKGHCCSIVGRVYAPQSSWGLHWGSPEAVPASPPVGLFKICFDPADYIDFATNSPKNYKTSVDTLKALSQDVKDSVITGICRHPFSSYALRSGL